MSRATRNDLNELHLILAQQLKARIQSGEATASDLNCARQFLKDNGIEALPGENDDLSKLTEAVREFDPDSIHRPH